MRDAARDLRADPTRSEAVLWEALRGKRLDGRKFRRQQPIGPFVVDFYCASERLVVEIDGNVHESQQEQDEQRQSALENLGLRFLRIPADLVERDLPSALTTIRQAFGRSAPLPHPSPPVGEGPGVGATPARPTNLASVSEAPDDDPAVRWMRRQNLLLSQSQMLSQPEEMQPRMEVAR